ncbi:MAG TPA: GSCFA domain-containing protein [Bacteroidales bacterium]|nr:GSCFA domain-containing protein [Bacteroidales bacterium]HCI55994.1 GSCFA domain protein [Bacteroidales bacterium]HOU95828.1 GSCFA domain-containing protein [Bacteroidales bacterium]HQG36900.1 GSCFA domain-containing protein [Bacteroidales bacterium]HQG52601.1 GSCFA domain-containing protein [Bacteroidales bacterium]
MILRTTFDIEPSREKISYFTPVLFIGSCFAFETGRRMEELKMKVMINPFGSVYNPVSVGNTIDIIMERKLFGIDDIFRYDNLYHSFFHNTEFSSDNFDIVIGRINESIIKAHDFLKEASFLFFTFGTARVYRLRENGMIVSNCHKLPSYYFVEELLSVDSICEFWMPLLDRIKSFNNRLKTIFTVSPVRYMKEGAHGNQVSKSVLFLSIEKLLSHPSFPRYFPAYELIIDDLRDYRFYNDDMVHPSSFAVNYVFNAFSRAYFSDETICLINEVMEIVKASKHRLLSPAGESAKKFSINILDRISAIEKKIPGIDFTGEKEYFNSLI